MLKRIIVGHDGGPEGRDAVALGTVLAAATGADLRLVGIFAPTLLPVIPGITDRRTLRAEAEAPLQQARREFAADALVEVVADDSISRGLSRSAERHHADLVVIGSQHRARQGRVSIGRRGRQVLYGARYSLAIAPRGFCERVHDLEVIGVGYDGGPEADVALVAASDLAQAGAASLRVRAVVPDDVAQLIAQGWTGVLGWDERLAATSAAALPATQARVAELGIGGQVSVTVGDPGYELRTFSDEVDLIAVGSRRWGAAARLISGGVGETLVADAGCPVLIVPRPTMRAAANGFSAVAGAIRR